MHLTFDQYLLLLRGAIGADQLCGQAHRHLEGLCPECRQEWEVAKAAGAIPPGGRDAEVVASPNLDGLPPPGHGEVPETSSDDALHVDADRYEREKAHLARLRELRRRAREDLARLYLLPREEWPGRVERATSRFRSRSFAELLLEEAANRVAAAPREAAALASLVPKVLVRHAGTDTPGWARTMVLRASAWHANALRVSGDLRGADLAFSDLLGSMQAADLDSPDVRAEIYCLEASLRIDQRDFAVARKRLSTAAEAYAEAGDDLGLAKTLVKRANLLQTLGRPTDIPPLLERAARLLEPRAQTRLLQCTVTGWINALCDLDRPGEARQVLESHRGLYGSPPGDHAGLVLGGLRARIDKGEGRLGEARDGFARVRDGLLALGRDFDAILASLHLADVLLELGELAKLRELAGGLVPLFAAAGVARESMAALRLLIEGCRAESVTASLIAEVRKTLRAAN